MKLTKISMVSPKAVITQYEPGTGFEANLRKECDAAKIQLVSLSASELVDNVSVDNSIALKKSLPEVEGNTLWVISEVDKLSPKKQVKLLGELNKLSETGKLGFVLPVTDLTKLDADTLSSAVLHLNTDNLRPVNPVNTLGVIGSMDPSKITAMRKQAEGEKSAKNKLE